MLSQSLEEGRSTNRRLPNHSTSDRREGTISTVATPLALLGVEVASVTDPNLRGLKTAVLRALWGATRM